MIKSLALFLPALVPSWRFFDVIAPSPRIELSLLRSADDVPTHWQEFRPRAEHLTIVAMFKRMLWNPRWNETLFLVSCSERLMQNPTEHSRNEIIRRIQAELKAGGVDVAAASYFQFRLVFLSRGDAGLEKHVPFMSSVHRITEGQGL